MNQDRVQGQLKQRRGKSVNHWGKVMNDELAAISGKYEELVGRLQEKFGIAEQQVEEFKKSIDHLKKSNADLRDYKNHHWAKKKSNGILVKAKTSSRRRQTS